MRGKLLTARQVESAKPGAARREIPDGGSGLYLVIQPSGAKSWALRYRFHGQPRKLTIGPYPRIILADARTAAGEALKKLDRGSDPANDKAEAKRRAPDTVRSLGAEFIEKWAKPRNRTWRQTERLLQLHVYPAIGSYPARDVARRDILDILDSVEKRGATVQANRVLAALRKFFNWCVGRDILEASPVAGVGAPAEETRRDRVLNDAQLQAFLKACDGLGDPFGPMFRLLLLTAQRRDEVASARWAEFPERFDIDKPLWTLPGERTKNGRVHEVPLAPQAATILEGIRAATAARRRKREERGKVLPPPSEFVFPSRVTPGRAASGFAKAKRALDEAMLKELQRLAKERGEDPKKAKLPAWRLHDLRRTAASGMARCGIGIHVVERLLNHVAASTTGGILAVYQRHDFADEKRRAAEAWANFIDQLVAPAPAKVVRLKR